MVDVLPKFFSLLNVSAVEIQLPSTDCFVIFVQIALLITTPGVVETSIYVKNLLLGTSHSSFSRKHAAAITENIFYYLTFQDVAHPIAKSSILKRQVIKQCLTAQMAEWYERPSLELWTWARF